MAQHKEFPGGIACCNNISVFYSITFAPESEAVRVNVGHWNLSSEGQLHCSMRIHHMRC